MTPSAFLSGLFGELDSGYTVLWRSDTRRSTWLEISGGFDRADKLAEDCRGKGADLYFGVCPQAGPPQSGRGGEDGVSALLGTWCDLDIAESAGAKKSKKKYPPLEVALRLVNECLPFKPSVLVNSGGGLHCYWLLSEPLPIAGDDDRARAKRITTGWLAMIGEHLGRLGDYTLDSTADLARVLRPAGTWNQKHAREVVLQDVYAEHYLWQRYTLADIENFLPHEIPERKSRGTSPSADYEVGQLVLSFDANPFIEKLETLRTNSPEFARVWDHKKEFASDSEREMSLAWYAVEAMWTDQEIANLLIAHRRSRDPSKLPKLIDRQDYIARTIAKVRGDANRDRALRAMNGASEPEKPAVAPPSSNGEAKAVKSRDAILAQLGAVFGVPIARWIRFGKENAVYHLVLATGQELRIGTIGAVVNNDRAFRSAIYDAVGVWFPHVKGNAWKGVCESLWSIVERVEPEESSATEAMRTSILAFIEGRDLYTESQKDVACGRGDTFIADNRLHINLPKFRNWLARHDVDKWDRMSALDSLRKLGFEAKHIRYQRGDTFTTRRYQVSPPHFDQ